MTRQDAISILITFVVGLFAGAYLYLAGFATTFEPPEATSENIYKEFVITGEGYGECEERNNCLSFQLLQNGAYRAILDVSFGESIVKEGSVPRALRLELNNVLTTGVLVEQSITRNVPECRYGDDSTNYRFKITRDEVDYELDSCFSVIDYESKAWLALVKLWNHFSGVEF
jgi:hypothetical protein